MCGPLALPLIVLGFEKVHRAYTEIGERLELGRVPQPPHRAHSLVVVPVSGLSRLTCQALTAARSLGDEVLAVTVTHPTTEDRQSADALRRDTDAVICRLRFRLGAQAEPSVLDASFTES